MNRNTPLRIAITLLTSVLIFSACTPVRQLEGQDKQAVLDYADPKTHIMLVGLISGNHTAFITDFDQTMQKSMTPQSLDNLRQTLKTKAGEFQSYRSDKVEAAGNFTIVYYNLVFDSAPKVIMKVVFQAKGSHSITGLWFDSLELRK